MERREARAKAVKRERHLEKMGNCMGKKMFRSKMIRRFDNPVVTPLTGMETQGQNQFRN